MNNENEFEAIEKMLAEQDETFEVIKITEDDGTERQYFVIDGIDVDNTTYMLVVDTEEYDKDEPEALLLKETKTEGDESVYVPVEDDAEYNKVIILLQDEDADYEMKF